MSKLSQAREERQRIIYLDAELEAAKIPEHLNTTAEFSRKATKSPSPRKRSQSPKKVAWDASTKRAELPIRNTLYDRDSSPISTRSWQESLRCPDSPGVTRHVTSTPVKRAVSTENISVIGQEKKMLPRSRSLPRNLHHEDLGSGNDLRSSYDRLHQAHLELTANVTSLERQLKVAIHTFPLIKPYMVL